MEGLRMVKRWMGTRALVVWSVAAAGAGCTMLAPVEYLKQDPPPGAIPYGKVVYVDDGKCPAQEVKLLRGGDASRNIPRHVECVPRPQ